MSAIVLWASSGMYGIRYLRVESVEKETREKISGYEYRTEHKPHSARNTDRHTGREGRYTHDTPSWKQANREGMFVGETEVIIGKAPKLGTHTWDGKIHL